MKKALALLLALTLLLGLAACASSEDPAPDAAADTPDAADTADSSDSGGEESFAGKTLTMSISMGDSNAVDAYYAQIEAFEEKYGCTVDVEAIPGGDEGENLTRVRLATGGLPDVFTSSIGAKFAELDPANNCLDLSGEPWIDNVTDGYREVATYDGGVYAVPADTSNAAGVLYNTKVFEELGLEIPETWDEFLQCCEDIQAAGVIPIAAPYAVPTNTQIPYLMNYYYVQLENPDFAEQYTAHEIDLDSSEAFLRGLQKLSDMVPYLNEDFLATGMDECARMLGEGTAAMMVIRTNILTTMEGNCPEAIPDIDFFPLPDLDPETRGISYWMPNGYAINKDAAEPELAKKWCEFVTTQEGIDAYCSAVVPAGTFMVNGITLSENAYPALITAQEWVQTASSPVMEYLSPIKGSNQATITSMVCSGEITAEDALQQIMEDNVVDAQQKGLEGW